MSINSLFKNHPRFYLFALMSIYIVLSPNHSYAEDWTNGREYGLEYQLEEVEGEKFVERTYIRWNTTHEKEIYNKENNQIDISLQGGFVGGYYKGGSHGKEDDFGSVKKARLGLTSEATAYYTYNTGYPISPVVSLGAEAEIFNNKRLEWQGDAGIGFKANVKKNTNFKVMYENTLFRRIDYLDDNKTYDQDDAYSVSVVAEKTLSDGTKRAIRIRYEEFEKTPYKKHKNGFVGMEPDTQHWLIAYRRTF